MNTNRKAFLLFLILIIVAMIVSGCGGTSSNIIVANKYANELTGTGLDGSQVIIEEFHVVINVCTETDHTTSCVQSDQLVTREQYNKNTVGQPFQP